MEVLQRLQTFRTNKHPTSAGVRDRTCVAPVSSGRRSSAICYQASAGRLCATMNRRYHSSSAANASSVMISLPSILRPHRFPCVLPLVTLAVTTVFLTVATGALAQGRYRNPDEAVAALADAVQADAPQQITRVLGPGSEEIVLSGDPVDDAAMRRRFLAAFEAKYQIVPDGKDQAVLIVGDERWPFPIRLVRLNNTWRFNTQLASSEM